MPILETLVTHHAAFQDRPHLQWVKDVLSAYRIGTVLKVFTGILHRIEVSRHPLDTSLEILPALAKANTLNSIRREVNLILDRNHRPTVFTRIHLLNFVKEALLNCTPGDERIDQNGTDQLLRAYLATHDHFPPGRDSGKATVDYVKEDFIRQSLLGLKEEVLLTLPRYWALWVTLPKKRGKVQAIETFLPPSIPRPVIKWLLPMLSMWIFWTTRADNPGGPVTLRLEYWESHRELLSQIQNVLDNVSLDLDHYKKHLQNERVGLKPDEQWEYSFLTLSRWPIVRIGADLYCLSLTLLLSRFTDGLYYSMLDACQGSSEKVNQLTSIFGEIFHEYVYDLWERIAGRENVSRIPESVGERKRADGLVRVDPDIFLYDAKSRRFTLEVHRSGSIDLLLDDLKKGVLKGAVQLDSTARDLRAGRLNGSLIPSNYRGLVPIVVTMRTFPELPFVYSEIDRLLDGAGLLKGDMIGPLLVIAAQTLEVLEEVARRGEKPTDLIAQKARDTSMRAHSIEDSLYATMGEIPYNQRMKAAFLAMLDAIQIWLSGEKFDEETIDNKLLPR